MGFSDDSDLPVRLDIREAEEKLTALREQFLSLRKLIAEPLSLGVQNANPMNANSTSSLVGQISKILAQVQVNMAQALPRALNGVFQGISRGGGLSGALLGGIRGVFGSSNAPLLNLGASLLGVPFGSFGGFFSNLLSSLFGGKSRMAREAQKQQEQLKKTREFMQQVLSQADSQDINSLQKALNRALNFKSGGGDAFREKQSTVNQLRSAIKDRQAVIQEAIHDFSLQNAALTAELQKFSDTPVRNLEIDYKNSLSDLQNERDKSLLQFKDSLAAQQQIEENFELKRQALLKQSSLDIIDTIIDEQNKIRTLAAQNAVNEAKISGNAIEQINAELQARLVAIDNDVAAFEGAEEEKTAFLKEKASERTLAIKQANSQVSDLLQEGLDILNEGLVTSQTKAENQQKRLTQLLGNLNPLGLIQADGSLLQNNITVGSGAIQMNFEGIQNAQDLIAQLSDPVIQNKLLTALNTALVRG